MWRWLLVGPLLLVLVLFALSNTDPVAVRFWPFDLAWVTPLAVAVLSVSALAFLLGATVAWAAALPARRRARSLAGRNRRLEAEVEELRAELAKPVNAPSGAPATGRAVALAGR
ncbi:lipopolysaccharide assembly protein LapA domain-containing protein [Roseomonas sp. OT10]|uniref:lipopolysaccharide assembly protein LapA domain-containing protein n=1 Tax=Roseomonas cutis TaxID=2897332 RepID=UPI001E4EDD81|nr:lipopolysaccharide assembly protein LapA domain-containing protein [Roseomonas sp. OT10]UFN51240.1 lipopolysaccharide assembly protein LapA domain-containing protein [Roseomonas sp. OT10]